jgi:hypothetical protein
VERMLTVVSTLRKQGRNVHGYLTDACSAKVSGIAPPSLLPDQAIDEGVQIVSTHAAALHFGLLTSSGSGSASFC